MQRGSVTLAWVLDLAQVDAWWAWWRTDIVQGAAWFEAGWLMPDGLPVHAYRFDAPPKERVTGPGLRRLTATLSYRPA